MEGCSEANIPKKIYHFIRNRPGIFKRDENGKKNSPKTITVSASYDTDSE